MMGAVPNQIAVCQKRDLEPLFSSELYVCPHQVPMETDVERKKHVASLSDAEKELYRKSNHLLAIAMNEVGYRNLVRLTSWGYLYGWGGRPARPRINMDILLQHKEGIIFTSCCYASQIGWAFETKGPEAAEEMVCYYRDMFGENFYLEIMMLDFKPQRDYDEFIIKMHLKYHIPLIISQDCFPEGTMVVTDRGPKPIESVEVGDQVWTHRNRFRSVQKVNKRKTLPGEGLRRISCRLGGFAFEVTPSHPLLVGEIRTEKNKRVPGSKSWKSALDVKRGDCLLVPKIPQDVIFREHDVQFIDLLPILGEDRLNANSQEYITYRGFDKISEVRIPRMLPVTEDLLKILGLYMAEGHAEPEGSQISFALHVNEVEEDQLCRRYFGQFGMTAYKRVSGNGMAIVFSSVIFNPLLRAMCGQGARNKQVACYEAHSFLRNWSKTQFLTMIYQYIKGDGCDRGFAVTVSSISCRLIYEISMALNALGMVCIPNKRNPVGTAHKNPNANPSEWNDCWVLVFSGQHKEYFDALMTGGDVRTCRSKRSQYFETEDHYWVRVVSNDPVDVECDVYNMQVEEDETYTANMYVVHNCHYAEPEDSKMQQKMLMMQTGRTMAEVEAMAAEGADMFELQDTQLWYKSEDELNSFWESEYSGVIDYEIFKAAKRETVRLCERARGVKLNRELKLPQIPNADEILLEEIKKGFKKRGVQCSQRHVDRIKEEYELITRKGFSSYFIIEKKFTDIARIKGPSILGYGDPEDMVGPGRGSAVGALTSYFLGITDVDPLNHDLLFSRFISEDRGRRMRFLMDGVEPLPGVA